MEREQAVSGETHVDAEPSAGGETSGNRNPPKKSKSDKGKPDKNKPDKSKQDKSKPDKSKQDKSGLMKRNTAREIAVHLAYELSFTDRTADALLAERLTAETFASLAEEDPLYATAPDDLQSRYISRLVSGISAHGAELDGYIEKYAVGWKFARIPLMASAIMRVAMYEMLYMPEIPNAAAVNSAVDIAKKYETPETVRFINGILGSFSRQELA